MVGRYDDDPLVQARHMHTPKYQGHPDGRCCMGCEADDPSIYVTWPCPVLNANRCEFEWDEFRCIQTQHEDDRHLVEGSYGQRMVMALAEDGAA